MSKSKSHSEAKRFVGVRALVTALMLVVDYVIPPSKDEAFIFNTWFRVVGTWTHSMREEALRWVNQRRMIASDHIVRKPLSKPVQVEHLPFAKKFTAQDIGNAVEMLQRNNVPPAPDGHYYAAIGSEQRVKVRELLEQDVLAAVSSLPNYARSVLRGAWAILEGHGPAFDDARLELVGMAFDLANGNKGVDARDLSRYAYHVLDMRLAPIPPKREQPSALTQTQNEIADECGKLCSFLIGKNRKYGDSALNPVHIFSKEPAHMQLRQQIDHKLARIQRGDASTEDEDTLLDLMGYLVLYRIALARRPSDRSEGKVKP